MHSRNKPVTSDMRNAVLPKFGSRSSRNCHFIIGLKMISKLFRSFLLVAFVFAFSAIADLGMTRLQLSEKYTLINKTNLAERSIFNCHEPYLENYTSQYFLLRAYFPTPDSTAITFKVEYKFRDLSSSNALLTVASLIHNKYVTMQQLSDMLNHSSGELILPDNTWLSAIMSADKPFFKMHSPDYWLHDAVSRYNCVVNEFANIENYLIYGVYFNTNPFPNPSCGALKILIKSAQESLQHDEKLIQLIVERTRDTTILDVRLNYKMSFDSIYKRSEALDHIINSDDHSEYFDFQTDQSGVYTNIAFNKYKYRNKSKTNNLHCLLSSGTMYIAELYTNSLSYVMRDNIVQLCISNAAPSEFNYTFYIDKFTECASEGDPVCIYYLGLANFAAGNRSLFLVHLENAANAGLLRAQLFLAFLYKTGLIVNKDEYTSLSWSIRAASQCPWVFRWDVNITDDILHYYYAKNSILSSSSILSQYNSDKILDCDREIVRYQPLAIHWYQVQDYVKRNSRDEDTVSLAMRSINKLSEFLTPQNLEDAKRQAASYKPALEISVDDLLSYSNPASKHKKDRKSVLKIYRDEYPQYNDLSDDEFYSRLLKAGVINLP